MAEALAAIVLLAAHAREHGVPVPKFRRRAWVVLAHRGIVASFARFGRVGLYAADMIVLGLVSGAELGQYAAARRVVFALVALGLLVPTAVAPAIARAWAAGELPARRLIACWTRRLMNFALPASFGLGLLADRWMPWLFGRGYRAGAVWLFVVAARLPWLLLASMAQAVLIACRREAWALRQVLTLVLLAALLLPIASAWGGAWGVGTAVLGLELVGALGGWWALARLGVAPPWHHGAARAAAGCLFMSGACLATRGLPIWGTALVGAAVYGATLGVFEWHDRRMRPEESLFA